MKRRRFIKNSLLAGIGSVIASPFISDNQKALAIIKPAHTPEPKNWNDNNITLTWIGHSTILLNFYGTWILTDPVFFERIGIYWLNTNWGPSRFSHPALDIDKIPKPDIMLLSHAHMDHMDYLTLKEFANKFPNQIDFVTAMNTRDVIEDLPWKSIKELDWNDSYLLNSINITAKEVKHFGWRFPWENDRSKGNFKDGRSYNAYILEKNGKKVLFGGDTAFMNKFENIYDEDIDIAIMPIGAYRPWRWNHCNPEEALIMADKIKAKYFIPIHTFTFEQGQEPREEALAWLKTSAVNYNIKVGLNEIGQTFSI